MTLDDLLGAASHGSTPRAGGAGPVRFRSTGERQLAALLDAAGLDYRYERPTPVIDRGRHRLWRPDFTLVDKGGLLLEYAGMLDQPSYRAGLDHKLRVYADNGYDVLTVTPAELNRYDRLERLCDRIENAACPYPSPRRMDRLAGGYETSSHDHSSNATPSLPAYADTAR